MRRALWMLVFLAAGCHDSVPCPQVEFIDGFTLVLNDDDWNPAQYSIEVSYSDRFGSYAFRCSASVPAFAWDGALDGGVLADAGAEAAGSLPCERLTPTGRFVLARAGKALVLSFEGTPTSAHVIVRDQGALLLEQDIEVAQVRSYPYGRACGGPAQDAIELRLPADVTP